MKLPTEVLEEAKQHFLITAYQLWSGRGIINSMCILCTPCFQSEQKPAAVKAIESQWF